MKKIVSWLAALSLTVSSMSMLTAGAEGTLSYVNEFTTSSDVWLNNDANRGTVEVDEENGWLVINNQGKSATAGSFEGYCKAAMDFTDKYVKIKASVKFDDFVSQKGLTFRTATSSSTSATVQWATVSGGALSFIGNATGKTLTAGEWYDFELKMDVSSHVASLTVTDKNGVVYSSGTTEMAGDWAIMAGTERLGAIVFQDSKKATDSVMTIDRYELSEITETEMYPPEIVYPETVYETEFTAADGDVVGAQNTAGKWGRNATRGTVTIDTENEVMNVASIPNNDGGLNVEYTLNETLVLAEKEFGFEIDTKVNFGDFNSQKQFIVRNSSPVIYANVNADGSLVFLGESTGVKLETEKNYNFRFMADTVTGKAYLSVTDEDDNIVYDSIKSNTKVDEEKVKSMDNLTRVGFFAAKNTTVASVFTVDSFKLKEILPSDIPEPDLSIIVSEDFSAGAWKNTHPTRGTVTHDLTAGTMVITNKQSGTEEYPDAGSMNADLYLAEPVNVEDSVLKIESRVKFDDFNTDKGLELRIETTSSEDAIYKSTHQYASVAPESGELVFMGTYTGVYLLENTWYDFTFIMNTELGYGNLLVKNAEGVTVYDSVGKVLNWSTVRAKAYNNMLSISRIGFTVFSSEETDSTMTVDSCLAKFITDEEELAAIDFTSSIHASLPMIELNQDMTQITATVTTKVFKAENVGKNYKGYFATYKEDGTLLGVKSIPVTTALSETSKSDTLVLTEAADYIKTYLWDADNGMKPVMVSGLYELIRE